jgi:hypothetical protein
VTSEAQRHSEMLRQRDVWRAANIPGSWRAANTSGAQCRLTMVPSALSTLPAGSSVGKGEPALRSDMSTGLEEDQEFPSLKSAIVLGSRSPAIAIGLPKHSSPGSKIFGEAGEEFANSAGGCG